MARKKSKAKQELESLFEAASADEAGSNGSGGNGIELNGSGGGGPGEESVALHEAAQVRYLNYALSVITSRALPDVRDGLKPVQRRILYTMWRERLTFENKHRKCAGVVGSTMRDFHPHGDTAIYDALVRLAQPFSMRMPLIDGSGNFGSLDGDGAAAMRYTECRLQRVSNDLLSEIGQKTVEFRPNYDGTNFEPVVLPAKLPNLLINGSTGIAVGMATNIPPHNPLEVCKALIRFIDALVGERDIRVETLCNDIKGPDFPTGGQIVNSSEELKQIYISGSGSVKLRGTYEAGPKSRGSQLVYVTSVPYTVNKAQLVERIAEVVVARKLPHLVDVRDISADDVRIELELKKDADINKVMAYLFKNTPLQTNFNVNMTCLIPTENPEVGAPADKMDLKTILWHFLHFRLEVVTKRLEHELGQLNKRIHILEGLSLVFDALDEIIAIIRASEGKQDAANKIMARFPADEKGGGLDGEQTDAILELKLYRLARLEILVIQNELEEKRNRVAEIQGLLGNEDARWAIVREEIKELSKAFKADTRRTIIDSIEDEPEYSADDFIIEEDNQIVLSRDGWIKRQATIRDASGTRMREGDQILAVIAGSTRNTAVFFSNYGTAYTARIADIPASTGYGSPIQGLFKLKDGEKIIAAYSLDPIAIGGIGEGTNKDGTPSPGETHAMAVTSDGFALRFGLESFVEPSTKNGRRFAKLSKGKDIVGVETVHGDETVIAISQKCRAILCPAEEIKYLSGAGKGVILIKLASSDSVVGFKLSSGDRDLMRVKTNRGAEKTVSTAKYEVTGRGGKGKEIQKNGSISEVVVEPPTKADWPE